MPFFYLYTKFDLHRIMSGFHGAFATGVAYEQGTLILLDTFMIPSPFWDLLVLQLFRPDSANLPCRYSTFHLEYLLVLSRFASKLHTLVHHNSPNITTFKVKIAKTPYLSFLVYLNFILITDNSFSNYLTKRSFSTHSFEDLYGKSYNIVYAIEWTLCWLMYVGET